MLQLKLNRVKAGSIFGVFALLVVIMPVNAQTQAARITDPIILQNGQQLFAQNCAACHGQKAQGLTKDWKQLDADGKYPPPPLNGTAHTWHHSAKGLVNTIQNGTISIGGNMPAWKGKLSKKDSLHIVIWLTSLWPDEIYQAWWKRNKPE